MDIESLRRLLDKFIDTSRLTDIEVLQIIEAESVKNDSFLRVNGRLLN